MSNLGTILFYLGVLTFSLLPFWGFYLLVKKHDGGETKKLSSASTLTIVGAAFWSVLIAGLAIVRGLEYQYLYFIPLLTGFGIGAAAAWRLYSGVWRRSLELVQVAFFVAGPIVLLLISTPYFRSARERSERGKALVSAVPVLAQPGATPQAMVQGLIQAVRTGDSMIKIEALRKLEDIARGYMPGGKAAAASPELLGEAVPELLLTLKDADPAVRSAAAETLSLAEDRAVPELLRLLNDPDQNAREAAAAALGGMSNFDKKLLPETAPLLSSPAPDVRLAAAATAAKSTDIAPETIPALIGPLGLMLESSDARERRAAADALQKIPAAALYGIAPKLIKALKDPDDGVRFVVFRSIIGKIRPVPGELIPALREALKDPNPRTRAFAVTAAADLGPESLPLIQEIMDIAEKDAAERYSAVYTLGEMGPAAEPAMPLLVKYLDDENETVRIRAREAAKKIAGSTRQPY